MKSRPLVQEDFKNINLFPEVLSNAEKPVEQRSTLFINLEFGFPGVLYRSIFLCIIYTPRTFQAN